MKQYNIAISRTCFMDFEVEASSIEEARGKALDEAYNTNWGGIEADYDFIDEDCYQICE